MFVCEICGKPNSKIYRVGEDWYDTCECGKSVKIIPKESRCIHCGAIYDEINFNIPSGCSTCGYSFVD